MKHVIVLSGAALGSVLLAGTASAQVYYPPVPVYVAPAPVYVAPAPVYVAPAPIYVEPAPRYMPPRTYVEPRVVSTPGYFY